MTEDGSILRMEYMDRMLRKNRHFGLAQGHLTHFVWWCSCLLRYPNMFTVYGIR